MSRAADFQGYRKQLEILVSELTRSDPPSPRVNLAWNQLGETPRLRLLERICRRPLQPEERTQRPEPARAAEMNHLRKLKAAELLHKVGRTWFARADTLRELGLYMDRLQTAASLTAQVSLSDRTRSKPMDSEGVNLDAALAALSGPARREVFEAIVVRSATVGEIAEVVRISRPVVGYHLKVLQEAGLIRAIGERKYQVVIEALPPLRSYFDRAWLQASLGNV